MGEKGGILIWVPRARIASEWLGTVVRLGLAQSRRPERRHLGAVTCGTCLDSRKGVDTGLKMKRDKIRKPKKGCLYILPKRGLKVA